MGPASPTNCRCSIAAAACAEFVSRADGRRSIRGRGSEQLDAGRRRRPALAAFEPTISGSSPARRRAPEQILARMGKRHPDDELNCGACGYDTAANTPSPSTRAWPKTKCACRTRSTSSAGHRGAGDSHAATGQRPGSPDAVGEAGQHGPTGRRHRPRSEQSAGRRADVRPPAAGRLPTQSEIARRPGDDRRAGRPLQEDRGRPAALRPAEQGRPLSDRHVANWSNRRVRADAGSRTGITWWIRNHHGATRSPKSIATRSFRCSPTCQQRRGRHGPHRGDTHASSSSGDERGAHSASATPASAFPKRISRRSSSRSSPPSRPGKGPAWGWPSPTASSRCTAATSASSPTPIPPPARPAPRSP